MLKMVKSKIFELVKDTIIDFGSDECKEIEILVLESLNLHINFEDENLNNINIKILVSEDCILNLSEFSNCKNLVKNISCDIKKDAILNHVQFGLSLSSHLCEVFLDEGSVYNVICVNYANSSVVNIENKVYHIGENSSSTMKVRCISKNGANVNMNGLISVCKECKRVVGEQKMRGVILDDLSNITVSPALEIENSDIICSHGASVFKINEEVLFYLFSRGITKKEILNLVLEGFIEEGLDKIVLDKFREDIEEKFFSLQ